MHPKGFRLSRPQHEYYARQLALPQIGIEGQVLLGKTSVCLVGVGGLGSHTALMVAGLGFGEIRLVDGQLVSATDLHRGYAYDNRAIGQSKVEAAALRMKMTNKRIEVQPIRTVLDSSNVVELLSDYDVVLDGVDNVKTRYIINEFCVDHGIPYIYASAVSTAGYCSTIIPKETACLNCFAPGLSDEDLETCATVGIHPSVLSIISAVQTSEAVLLATRRSPTLKNRILCVSVHDLTFDKVEVQKRRGCSVCSGG